MTISRVKAIELIGKSKGKCFTVVFVKRTDGSVRTMNCRLNVKKYTVGGTLAYNPTEKHLIPVWDTKAKSESDSGYRMINTDSIISVTIEGVTYEVEPETTS